MRYSSQNLSSPAQGGTRAPTLQARSPNHWATREIPVEDFLDVVSATVSGEHPGKASNVLFSPSLLLLPLTR